MSDHTCILASGIQAAIGPCVECFRNPPPRWIAIDEASYQLGYRKALAKALEAVEGEARRMCQVPSRPPRGDGAPGRTMRTVWRIHALLEGLEVEA